MQGLTNGNWSIFVTNSATTNVYYFAVTADVDSNSLPSVVITFPSDGAVNVTNQPTYTWQGPDDYNNLVVYGYNLGLGLPATQTSLPSPRVLYQGIGTSRCIMTATRPPRRCFPASWTWLKCHLSWVSTAHLQDYINSQFTVGAVDTSGTFHTLVAHYAWDGTNADGSASARTSSGNGYDLNFERRYGARGGANSSPMQWTAGRGDPVPQRRRQQRWLCGLKSDAGRSAYGISGSFSISCWIKTTQGGIFRGTRVRLTTAPESSQRTTTVRPTT